MEEIIQPIYLLIKQNKGRTLDEITELAGMKETAVLDTQIKKLIETGYVSFFNGKLYPNIWTVGLVPKGERHAAVEIELAGITVENIRQELTPYEGDPLFFEPYPIEEGQHSLFEKASGIEFDYNHFDYYLLCGFDNSEEQSVFE